jgi:hypothetical protein
MSVFSWYTFVKACRVCGKSCETAGSCGRHISLCSEVIAVVACVRQVAAVRSSKQFRGQTVFYIPVFLNHLAQHVERGLRVVFGGSATRRFLLEPTGRRCSV